MRRFLKLSARANGRLRASVSITSMVRTTEGRLGCGDSEGDRMHCDGIVLIPATTPPELIEARVDALMDAYAELYGEVPRKQYVVDNLDRIRAHFGLTPDAPLAALLPRIDEWFLDAPDLE